LGPCEPDLSRGSVAFVPSIHFPSYPDSGRLKVLIVSPLLPYPLSHGGAVRIYNLCRALADRVDFILVALREAQDVVQYAKLREVFREIYIADLDERASLDQQLPAQVRHHQSRSLRALLADVAARWKPDLIQIEYTHMAGFRDCAPGIPAILVEHDLTFSLYRQLLETQPSGAARREYDRWLAFEQRWLSAYDAVWTVSADDRECAIREGSHADRTFVVPNGVDTVRFEPREAPEPSPELFQPELQQEIFYVGSFRHLPNILGFEKLRYEVMPRVWERYPNTRLRVIAGPRHELFSRMFSRTHALQGLDRRIEVHGFVEDLRPFYARASVVVAPLDVSAGTNIKVLEALACGKAIVSTPIGCAGLGLQNGYDALIRSDWASFAHSVCDLLADPEMRSRVASNARRTAEQRFSWTAIEDSAYRSYLALAANSKDSRVNSAAVTAFCG
jgi:glycosyltransferase involved in cell wall biosynthesis